jgi:hypothetical protein
LEAASSIPKIYMNMEGIAIFHGEGKYIEVGKDLA